MSLSAMLSPADKRELRALGMQPFKKVEIDHGCDPSYLNARMVEVIAKGKSLRLQLQYAHARVAYAERVGVPLTAAYYGWLLRAMIESSANLYPHDKKILEQEWCWNDQLPPQTIISLQNIGTLFHRMDPQKYEAVRKVHEVKHEV
jgi:hypothetical protein